MPAHDPTPTTLAPAQSVPRATRRPPDTPTRARQADTRTSAPCAPLPDVARRPSPLLMIGVPGGHLIIGALTGVFDWINERRAA